MLRRDGGVWAHRAAQHAPRTAQTCCITGRQRLRLAPASIGGHEEPPHLPCPRVERCQADVELASWSAAACYADSGKAALLSVVWLLAHCRGRGLCP